MIFLSRIRIGKSSAGTTHY